MIFVILDTNVLVSSFLNDKGVPSALVRNCIEGRCYMLYSSGTLREYYDVLNREKFHLESYLVEVLLDRIELYGYKIKPRPIDINFKDKNDKKFYELFQHCASPKTYFVTGNMKDFPNNDHIINSKEMMQLLDSDTF